MLVRIKKEVISMGSSENNYEVRIGTFENAVDLDIQTFRAFPTKARAQQSTTGGVRCEKASYALLNEGYKEVYQLDGGILKYFEKVGGAHYKVDCFIFDDRLALKPDLTEADVACCYTCRNPSTS
ncbi:hypothetical protein PsorP6_000660 [Peronosclerospora sorghi]|uniref:Uncharacterized protein n=1 Tax=Peronosclerospora sorghi TaxID=230839 RepID=A0ACC0WW57_9STRA|nr:hypothetical protein PsorP6_000660 [Peronosclerospora sorghi]